MPAADLHARRSVAAIAFIRSPFRHGFDWIEIETTRIARRNLQEPEDLVRQALVDMAASHSTVLLVALTGRRVI